MVMVPNEDEGDAKTMMKKITMAKMQMRKEGGSGPEEAGGARTDPPSSLCQP